ncbi:hypothetical protein [Nocardia sp. NRRL S-836]|uniref:hypothetical protein n=1 Tax=Nocardia sp. NRRL S-836 TaxID=1519492 RepID=UPI0006AF5AD7|nr:hypothetical protein [Nocardia sp. NRRL S-836]KOV77449.1 hypothetical protein ADL03_41715 [Nocardia sp. NRRL S-836]
MRAANLLLTSVRELTAVGKLYGRAQYTLTKTGRDGGSGQGLTITILGATEEALMKALVLLVDGNAERAAELRTQLRNNDDQAVEPRLMTLAREWFPLTCWNSFCRVEHCSGIEHCDSTGHSWTQREGFVYNPRTDEYDLREHDRDSPVQTLYRRDAVTPTLVDPDKE